VPVTLGTAQQHIMHFKRLYGDRHPIVQNKRALYIKELSEVRQILNLTQGKGGFLVPRGMRNTMYQGDGSHGFAMGIT
jgi:hypothetical protein